MRTALTIFTVIVLYLIFSFASCVAGALGLAALLIGRAQYTSRICRAMDALFAAMLGWDGRATVSKECGRSSCRFCRALCAVLNVMLEQGHCEKEAKR